MKREYAFFGLAAAAFFIKMRSDSERNQLRTERYRIPVRNQYLKGLIRADAEGRPVLRLVFLTDLHEKEFGPGNERLLARIAAERPDAVLIGGDCIICRKSGEEQPDEIENTVRLLERLRKRYRIFFGLGNHEQRLAGKAQAGDRQAQILWARLLKALEGVEVLDNRTVRFGGVSISGVGLGRCCYEKCFMKRQAAAVSPAALRARAGELPRDCFHIFLLHSPLYFREACRAGADLVLSGHFHGGTIRLPFLGGMMTPQYQFFLSECAGLFRRGRRYMLVSRGLGTHSVNIRLNNKPELSVIELVGTDGKPGLSVRQRRCLP